MDILQKDFVPDALPEREDELNDLHSALIPAARGSTPLNTFLYGKSGQGKTATARLKTKQLKEQTESRDDVDITIVTVQCNSLNKSYHVIGNLVKQLRGPGAQKPRGYPQQDLFEMAFEEMNKIGGTIIVVLDEVDSIGNDDDVLYELPRASHNGYIDDDVKISVIGISNDFQFRDNLRPKVKDTLCDEEIEFKPYNAKQLQAILRRRADKALKDDVLEEGVIELCSAYAAQDKASARQALRYLFKAARLTDERGEKDITLEHVEEAKEEIDRELIYSGIENLTTHDHLALAAVTFLEIQNELPARSKRIYQTYRKLADVNDTDPSVLRRFRDRLRDLELYNVLNFEENAGYQEGTYYEYKLAVSLDMLLDVFPAVSDSDDIPALLKEEARKHNRI